MLDRDHEREPTQSTLTGQDRSRLLWGGWGWTLVALVPLTSLAAASVSAWLVPPYLILMAGLLLAPDRKVRREARGAGTGGESPRERGATVRAERPDATEGSGPETATGAEVATVAAAGTAVAKPKRGRGKGKGKAKAKAESGVAPEPVRVNWVRVGPGQFVRVEEASAAEVGPHSGEAPSEGEDAGPGSGPELPTVPEDARDGEEGGSALDDRPVGGSGAESASGASEAASPEAVEGAPEVLGWADPGQSWDAEGFVEPAAAGPEVEGGEAWSAEARGVEPRAEGVTIEPHEAEGPGWSAEGPEGTQVQARVEGSCEHHESQLEAVGPAGPGFTPGSEALDGCESIARAAEFAEEFERASDDGETGNAPSAPSADLPYDFVPISAAPGPLDSPDPGPTATRPHGLPPGRRPRRARRTPSGRDVRGIVSARNRPRRRANGPRRGARASTPRAPPGRGRTGRSG